MAEASVPARVLTTLEVLLAPGKQIRLSRFVESAQLEVLFAAHPDPEAWNYSSEAILDRNMSHVKRVASRWTQFAGAGKPFTQESYSDKDFLA